MRIPTRLRAGLTGGLLAALLLSLLPVARATAQGNPSATEARVAAQVRQAAAGPDGAGKDGPLAHVHPALLHLHLADDARQTGGRAGVPPVRPASRLMRVADGRVVVEAVARTDAAALQRDLEALGLEGGARAARLVSGWLPVAAVREAAALPSLQSLYPSMALAVRASAMRATVASPPHAPFVNLRAAGTDDEAKAGQATSEGVAVMRADEARDAFGVDGSGVVVGVLSDSFDNYEPPDDDSPSTLPTDADDDIASGDLPPPERLRILDDGIAASDEGRAMMQIIHDVAPGATLAYHTALGGEPAFAQGIRDLADNGATVIVDDIIYLAEPMFQDGVVARAVDDVVQAGAAYVSAAGNNGSAGYDAPSGFADAGIEGPAAADDDQQGALHDFDPGEGVDAFQQIRIPPQTSVFIVLQWADPFAGISASGVGAQTDLDLFLLDASQTTVLNDSRQGLSNNRLDAGGTGVPVEIVEYENTTDIEETINLAITRFDGPVPDRMRYVIFDFTVPIDDFAQPDAATSYGHANTDGGYSVAATSFFNAAPFLAIPDEPAVIAPFSSVGGIPILFDDEGTRLPSPVVRDTPNITGPDGVDNTFFSDDLPSSLPEEDDTFPNFFGTSAAAPHLAGVAALMRQVAGATPADVYDAIGTTARDVRLFLPPEGGSTAFPIDGADGFDFRSGEGLVDALEAVRVFVERFRLVTGFRAQAVAASGSGLGIRASWTEQPDAGITSFRLERTYVDREGYRTDIAELPPVRETQTLGGEATQGTFDGLDAQVGTHRVQLFYTTADGTEGQTAPATVTLFPDDAEAALIRPFAPNPSNGAAQLEMVPATEQARVTVRLFNALGQRVATLFDGPAVARQPVRVSLRGVRLASGVYFARIEGDTFAETTRVVVVR